MADGRFCFLAFVRPALPDASPSGHRRRATLDRVAKSLYAAFGERVVGLGRDPGTLYTASVETIDNDVALQELAVLADAEPSSGTGIAGVVDEDDAPLAAEPLASGSKPGPKPRPRPKPGTTLTATIETTDEDASSYLDHLR